MKATIALALLASLAVARRQDKRAEQPKDGPTPPIPTGAKVVSIPDYNNGQGGKYQIAEGRGQPQAAPAPGCINPVVTSPATNSSIKAGDDVVIEWNGQGKYGQVVVDVINTKGYMNAPQNIGVYPAEQGKAVWHVPDYYKAGDGYDLRVWGCAQPGLGEQRGQSTNIRVENTTKGAQTFIVNTPSKVALGQPCPITWNFCEVSSHPEYVDVNLCREDGSVVRKLATVRAEDKSWTWNVPSDDPDLCNGKYHLQLNGGASFDGKTANDYGCNSEPITVVEQQDDLVVDDLQEVDSTTTVTVDVTEVNGAASSGLMGPAKFEMKVFAIAVACIFGALLF
jgi:hypothetical protein